MNLRLRHVEICGRDSSLRNDSFVRSGYILSQQLREQLTELTLRGPVLRSFLKDLSEVRLPRLTRLTLFSCSLSLLIRREISTRGM